MCDEKPVFVTEATTVAKVLESVRVLAVRSA